jgi:tetratricopeptide (TPR) repeat protein
MTPESRLDRVGHAPGCLDAELLARYVDGKTSEPERRLVQAHLARCEDCYFAFSETVRAQGERADTETNAEPVRWAWWMPRLAAGLAAAAVIAIVAFTWRPWRSPEPIGLQPALSRLDAAIGSTRRIEPRVVAFSIYRAMGPRMRAGEPAGVPPSAALRDAALAVETAATSPDTGVDGQRALAVMYLSLGQADRAASIIAPLAPETGPADAGLLSDAAAIYLARGAEGDARRAAALLTRAVSLELSRAEAWFNLGLAGEATGQPNLAFEAWTYYLKLDSTSGWAAEARAHLKKLQTTGKDR